MASKERGGLSKREFAAQKSGKAMPYGTASSSSVSSGGLKAPKAPSYGSFKFDSSKLIPQYQTEAASLFNPQLQQIQGLRQTTASQIGDAKTKTNDEFAQLLKRETENINRRGAFFSGGAIDQENRIGAQQAGAIRDLGYQEQQANNQYAGQEAQIGQASKDYVSSKVEGAYSSAYKTFQDNVSNQMNSYQLQLGQYNTDKAFNQNKIESDRNYALSAAASARAGSSAANSRALGGISATAQEALLASRGEDGKTDPAVYAAQKAAYMRANGSAADFDADFGGLLSSNEQSRLGLSGFGQSAEQVKAAKAQESGINQASTAAQAIAGLASRTAGFSGAVGAKGFSSFFGIKDKPLGGTDAAGYSAEVDRVKSLLVLPELAQLRGLGAMSDREFGTISSGATSLTTALSEKDFNNELVRVQDALAGTLNRAAEMGLFKPNYVNVYDLNTGDGGVIPDYEFNPSKYKKQ